VIAGSNNDAIDIYGTGTDGNVVAGNFIGTDVNGTQPLGIAGDGVFLAESASSNWIGVNPLGGPAIQDEGNVISGNGYDGVQLDDSADSNVIAGNKIGTDVSGTVALGNSFNGVGVNAGCYGNTIGGTALGDGNVISANAIRGLVISGDGADDNLVQGNSIGTDIRGPSPSATCRQASWSKTAPRTTPSAGLLLDRATRSLTTRDRASTW